MEEHVKSSESTVPPVLEVQELRKTFSKGSVVAVDGVSFEVNQGEILAILGPSGCGKTTIMRNIAGLDEPDSGNVLLHGRSVIGIPPHRRNIGLVFQDLAVFPHKTVFENVAFGLRMKRAKRDEIKHRVDKILSIVELPFEEFGERMPSAMSGGQKQRVALARTLVIEPRIVLFDEPMAALDRRLRDRMVVELRQILKRLGIPTVYVTHDQESASFFADRITLMDAGRIIQIGTPLEIYRCPISQFVANFIGDTNFFGARVVASEESETIIELFGETVRLGHRDVEAGTQVTLGIRPEELELTAARTDLSLFTCRLAGWNFNAGIFTYQGILKDGTEFTVRSSSGEFTGATEADIWVGADPEAILFLKE